MACILCLNQEVCLLWGSGLVAQTTILEKCHRAKVVAAGTTSHLKSVPPESQKLSRAWIKSSFPLLGQNLKVCVTKCDLDLERDRVQKTNFRPVLHVCYSRTRCVLAPQWYLLQNSANSKHLACTKPLTGKTTCQTWREDLGHVHSLLRTTWYLPLYLKVTPRHHSSYVRPEEIQGFNRASGRWPKCAAAMVATGGIAAAL